MSLQIWGDAITGAFQSVWVGVIAFLPNFIVAIVIIILGWIIAALVGKVVAQLIKSARLDNALEQAGFDAVLKRASVALDSGAFIGGLVKWFIIAVSFMAALEVLKLSQVSIFLQENIIRYIPNVIISVFVLLVAIIAADFVQKLVVVSVKAAQIRSAHFIGALTKWTIWIFAFFIILPQLGIAGEFIGTLYTGIVTALALAFGLAFGLGGQEAAARFIEKVRHEITDHQA